MPYNTGNPIPSSDAKDLSDNAENLDNSVNTALDTWTDRLGVERRTIQGQLKLLGYTAPDIYAGGLVFTIADNMATIERNKIIYAPLPSAIPFTTSGTWTADDEDKFFVVQGVTTENLNEALEESDVVVLAADTVADMKTKDLQPGQIIRTKVNNTTSNAGGALYLIQTAAEFGGTPDGFGDHALDNGNIAAIKNNLISPEQYGAVGDGVVDDTAPLLAYIEKTNDIFLTQGRKYQTTGLVISNKTDFRIFGKGALTIADAANKNVIEFFECERFSVKDIELDGNGDNQTELINRNNGCCVRFSLCKDWEISSTYCHDNYSGATILAIDNVTDATLLRTNGKILYNTIQNAGKVGGPLLSDGIFANSDNTQIEGNTISDCTDYGIAGDYSQYMSIKDNIITNVLIGIGALGAKFWEVSGNSINEAGQGIGVTLSGNPAVNPYLSENVKIHHNHITNITRDPLGTPNGDAIFVDPSAKYVETSFNTVDVAFRGIADTSIETMSAYNRVYNVADRPYFISGSGSWIQFNEWENAATGPLYGEVSNKTVLEKDHVSVTDATMQAPWVNFGGVRQDCGYYRQLGRVYLVGSATGGSTSAIFTLPAGYRPSHNMNFTVAAGLSDTAIITVNTEGAVIWLSGTATDVHLNSIQFIANGNIG